MNLLTFRLFLFFAAFACVTSVQAGEPLRVVTSFSVLEGLANQLGGDRVVVESIIPRRSDPHSYQIKPSDVRKVSKADIVIFNGHGFEGWMTRLLGASKFKGKLIVSGEENSGDTMIDDHGREGEHAHEEDEHAHEEDEHAHGEDEHAHEDDEHAHVHGEYDPHVWHDPHKIIISARKITKGFIEIDNSKEAYYSELLVNFERIARELSEELTSKLADVRGGTLLLQHGGMEHFSEAFDIKFEALEGPSGVSTVSGKRLQQLEKMLKDGDIDAIAYEYGRNDRVLRQLSNETCVNIDGPLYIDNLGEKGEATGTWVGMMRHNALTIFSLLSTKRTCE